MKPPDPSQPKKFRARRRVLMDILLILDIAIFLLFTIKIIPIGTLLPILLIIDTFVFLSWHFLAVPLTRVEVTVDSLIGPSQWFLRTTIPLGQVDLSKTNRPKSKSDFTNKLFKDVWAKDGRCIRLHRRILGQHKIRQIMALVERYPVREGKNRPAPPLQDPDIKPRYPNS